MFTNGHDADAWYQARLKVATGKGMRTHLYHTLIGWEEISATLLPHLARIGEATPSVHDGDGGAFVSSAALDYAMTIFSTAPVYRCLAWNPDVVLNTLRYLYSHCRCGIFVAIRRGAVAAFFPFVNPVYINTWSKKLKLADGMTLLAYTAEKSKVLRRASEDVLPPSRWWMNSGIICNVMPATCWGDAYLAALRNVLDTTCSLHAVPDVDFFINKRDHPVLTKKIGGEPYAEFTGDDKLAREVYSTYAPISSFYTGSGMADLPMPPTEDWCIATGRSFPGSPFAPFSTADAAAFPVFSDRKPLAVFRGSATGRGTTSATNARLLLIEVASPGLVDAAITAYNFTRDKIVSATLEEIVVDFRRPSPSDRPTAPFMSLAAQFSAFRYVVYVDGHAAASRYGTLMHSGCVILKTVSRHPEETGHLWMFPELVGAEVKVKAGAGTDADSLIPEDADHMIIDAEFKNLNKTVEFLNANEDIACRIAENARRRAPSILSITAYWNGLLKIMHEAYFPSTGPTLASEKAWYSHLDRQYARIGKEAAPHWSSHPL